ncbi:MAG: 4Fe-4S binding protein [Deltaproteobacteria bacterium]|nr:4Fe-4S binding protein [Deltaproteobacteria bacterium]
MTDSEVRPYKFVVRIKDELCTGCENCLPLCPYLAMKNIGNRVYVLEEKCRGCVRCLPACPEEAIYPVKIYLD